MYLRRTRLNAACKMLRETAVGLAEIAVQCGFNDQTNMTRAFRQELKITPLKYRRSFSEAAAPCVIGRYGFDGVTLLKSNSIYPDQPKTTDET